MSRERKSRENAFKTWTSRVSVNHKREQMARERKLSGSVNEVEAQITGKRYLVRRKYEFKKSVSAVNVEM